jgi:phospholipid/cholesterol/gamma-HCH transport system substrate-binding protein
MSSAARQRTATVKVGVLTIVSLALLAGVLIWLRGKGLAQGQEMTAFFDDVNGLRDGAPIQMMGIRVGFVDKVVPRLVSGTDPNTHSPTKKYRVQVYFTIQKDLPVKIPQASRLSIEQSGLIGEQFLEITPPRLKEVSLKLAAIPNPALPAKMPVKLEYEEGLQDIGVVENIHIDHLKKGLEARFLYRVTRPGTEMPEDAVFHLGKSPQGLIFLHINPRDGILSRLPDDGQFFTVENPLRMKRFLDIQMESAEALKTTNDKLNQLMSDETIASLQSTLKNTEILTSRASSVMDSANALFRTTQKDMSRLVGVSEELAMNVSSVSKNVNILLGDSHLRGELNETAASFRESSSALKNLLNDPALKTSLRNANSASSDAAQLMATLKGTWGSPEQQQRLVHVTSALDTSLSQLNRVLNTLEQSLDGKDENLKGILEDTRTSAKNLRELSDKFSGHFTLFKLLF